MHSVPSSLGPSIIFAFDERLFNLLQGPFGKETTLPSPFRRLHLLPF